MKDVKTSLRTPLIALPYAKENRTLWGMDILQKIGIVPNLKRRKLFLSDSFHRTYNCVKEAIIHQSEADPTVRRIQAYYAMTNVNV
ncbi:hypothetical protein NPIL_603731 [Nephila pilipes]|uniref:Uncharacterized protein n=1 Tax=Nephila pilipes TaxID=299642 RepID=A0A8X6P9A0_NEPPI|nr:hypothetical protein NPIL_603731 [Nephila pilipes]